MVLQILRTMIRIMSDIQQASANRSSQAGSIPQRRQCLSTLCRQRDQRIPLSGSQEISEAHRLRIRSPAHTKHQSGIRNVRHKAPSNSSRLFLPTAQQVSCPARWSMKRAEAGPQRRHSATAPSFSSLSLYLLCDEDILGLLGLFHFTISNNVCPLFGRSSTELHRHCYASIFTT